jgi:hypothetical protein
MNQRTDLALVAFAALTVLCVTALTIAGHVAPGILADLGLIALGAGAGVAQPSRVTTTTQPTLTSVTTSGPPQVVESPQGLPASVTVTSPTPQYVVTTPGQTGATGK